MARPEWRGGDLRPDNRRRRQFPMIDLPSSNRFVIPSGEQLPTWSGGGTVTGAGGGASSSVNVPGVDSMQLLRNWRQSRMFNNPRITAYYNDFRPEGMSDEQWSAALNAYLEEQIYPNMLSNDPVISPSHSGFPHGKHQIQWEPLDYNKCRDGVCQLTKDTKPLWLIFATI